jgi:hypothetical protein
MVEQCRPYLAFDEFTNATLANYLQRMVFEDAEQSSRAELASNTGMLDKTYAAITGAPTATAKWLGSFFSAPSNEQATPAEKLVRSYCFSASKVPTVEPDHWTLFRNQDSYSLMYKFISHPETRTPGACDDRSTERHTPLSELGETGEWMHPSVRWRQEKSKGHEKKEFHYNSEALAALNYEKKHGAWGWKGWEHKKDGKADREVWIPEWPIEAALKDGNPSAVNENAELAVIDACLDKKQVRKFLREHAAAWNKANASAR